MNHTNEHKPPPDHGVGIFVAVASTKKATQIKESLLSVLFLTAGVRLFGGILPPSRGRRWTSLSAHAQQGQTASISRTYGYSTN